MKALFDKEEKTNSRIYQNFKLQYTGFMDWLRKIYRKNTEIHKGKCCHAFPTKKMQICLFVYLFIHSVTYLLMYSLKVTCRPMLSCVDIFLTPYPYVCFERINTVAVITRTLPINEHISCNVPLSCYTKLRNPCISHPILCGVKDRNETHPATFQQLKLIGH
jgi:hypothetical protein